MTDEIRWKNTLGLGWGERTEISAVGAKRSGCVTHRRDNSKRPLFIEPNRRREEGGTGKELVRCYVIAIRIANLISESQSVIKLRYLKTSVAPGQSPESPTARIPGKEAPDPLRVPNCGQVCAASLIRDDNQQAAWASATRSPRIAALFYRDAQTNQFPDRLREILALSPKIVVFRSRTWFSPARHRKWPQMDEVALYPRSWPSIRPWLYLALTVYTLHTADARINT